MSLIILMSGSSSGTSSAELRNNNVKLITGHIYRLSFAIRTNLPQEINVVVDDSTGGFISTNQQKNILSDIWQTVKFDFTSIQTDSLSRVRVQLNPLIQETWFDQFKLIDLTVERKEYRIMRIQGSVLPGSFVQILTLREKTANETA